MPGSSLPVSIHSCKRSKLRGSSSLLNRFGITPNLGVRRHSGDWPPSKVTARPPPCERWPRVPKPAERAKPWPLPTPRPLRRFRVTAPGLSASCVIVSERGGSVSGAEGERGRRRPGRGGGGDAEAVERARHGRRANKAASGAVEKARRHV